MKGQNIIKYLIEACAVDKNFLAHVMHNSKREFEKKLDGEKEFMSHDLQILAEIFGRELIAHIFFSTM